jgi:2-oxoglutarate-Fe(II)-dependent oxygenase superfamily protein
MAVLARLTLQRTEIPCAAGDIERAAACFEREHAVRLPGFLAPDLLGFVQEHIERDGFVTRVHDTLPGRPTDLVLNPSLARGILLVAANDAAFLKLARTIVGRTEIRSFAGTIHRRVPGAGHEDAWHNDLGGGRLAVMTINLSPERFQGGELQIREGANGPIVFTCTNDVPGDAVLFKIDPLLKHRVTSPTGRVPRTVFAGWFRADPPQHVLEMAGSDLKFG